MLGSSIATALVTAIATALASTASIYASLTIIDEEFTFSMGGTYSPYELDRFASIILRTDIRQNNTLRRGNPILLEEHVKTRMRREIYNKNGYPDPNIVQGMYWKTDPRGRKVNSEEARRRSGASFFRLPPFLPVEEYLIGKNLLSGEFGEKNLISRIFNRGLE